MCDIFCSIFQRLPDAEEEASYAKAAPSCQTKTSRIPPTCSSDRPKETTCVETCCAQDVLRHFAALPGHHRGLHRGCKNKKRPRTVTRGVQEQRRLLASFLQVTGEDVQRFQLLGVASSDLPRTTKILRHHHECALRPATSY